MPHMVVFRTKEGKQGYHLADTLDDAVRFVEHLRNNEQVDDSKVYRMHEVPIEFKVMYKVEVAGQSSGPAPSQGEESAGGGSPRGSDSASARSSESASPRSSEPAATGSASSSGARGEDRSDSGRVRSNSSVTATSASAPVSETGGRFGLFSRA